MEHEPPADDVTTLKRRTRAAHPPRRCGGAAGEGRMPIMLSVNIMDRARQVDYPIVSKRSVQGALMPFILAWGG